MDMVLLSVSEQEKRLVGKQLWPSNTFVYVLALWRDLPSFGSLNHFRILFSKEILWILSILKMS